MMKKHFFFLLILASVGSAHIFGLDVDEDELSLTRNTAVEFINYEGPHSKIESLDQIMGIGVFLGKAIRPGYSTAGYAGKYRVIHAIGETSEAGLDADIFVVLSGAQVDHIRNMRYMIAGYLIAAYGYNLEDALVLAEFVTVYNAVYRGKMDFFDGKYKPIVVDNIEPSSVGISTLYTDWAGKTEMVIPLSEFAEAGGLSKLDTDALTDDQVIDEMRIQDDMGLDSRKEITELKEREVEETQAVIEAERDSVDEERERIERERVRIETEREAIDREQETADSDSQQVLLDLTESVLEAEQESLDVQEEIVDQREQDLIESEAEQAERIDRIHQEREEIAADERTLMEREAEDEGSAVATTTSVTTVSRIAVFLEVREIYGESLGRLVHINTGSGAIVEASTINSIRNRQVETFGSSYIVVAGTTSGQGAVRLMTLEQESLETGKEGSADIYEGSIILVDGVNLFAVTGNSEGWKLGKFDSSLILRQVSAIDVFEETSITLVDDTLLVAGADGGIYMLAKSDLSEIGTVQ